MKVEVTLKQPTGISSPMDLREECDANTWDVGPAGELTLYRTQYVALLGPIKAKVQTFHPDEWEQVKAIPNEPAK